MKGKELETDLDPEEASALHKFSEQVTDLQVDNETLLRFLRARDRDIGKAEQMLRKSLKWREENAVENYRNWVPPKALADDFIVHNLGSDYQGYPVIYIPLGRWNVRDRIEEGYFEETMLARFYLLEGIVMAAIEQSCRTQFALIVDLAQLTFYKVAHLDTMNMVVKIFQDFDANYPERLKSAFIINTPWIFPYAFSLVKPWLAPRTLAKVDIFDGNKANWLPALQKRVPKGILPSEISLGLDFITDFGVMLMQKK